GGVLEGSGRAPLEHDQSLRRTRLQAPGFMLWHKEPRESTERCSDATHGAQFALPESALLKCLVSRANASVRCTRDARLTARSRRAVRPIRPGGIERTEQHCYASAWRSAT